MNPHGKIEKISPSLIFFNRYKKHILITLFFFLIVLLNPGIKNLIIMVILFIVGAVSQIHQKYIQPSLGFECYLFGTVIVGVVFGSVTGLFFGLFVTIAASIISGRMSAASFSLYLTTSLMGFLSPYVIGFLGISLGGALISLLSSVIITLFFMLYFGSDILRAITYSSTNIILNIFLFSLFGPPLLHVMTGI
jgi:hypothetical protein